MIISRATSDRAPVILLYGAEGRGKTTLACKFPNPVAVLLERGLPRGIVVDAVEGVSSHDGVLETLRELYSDPRGYRTLIIDTLDSLEGLLIESVCHKNGLEKHRDSELRQGIRHCRSGVATPDPWHHRAARQTRHDDRPGRAFDHRADR